MRNYETGPIPEFPLLQEIILPVPDFTRPREVIQSLTTYTEMARKWEEFDTIKRQHIRIPYADTDLRLLEPINKYDGTYGNYYKSFFMDGNYGFMLGGKTPEDNEVKPLALAAFDVESNGGVIIKQLQGRLRKDNLSQSEKGILEAYRWEFILVNLIASWADKVQLPSITIQSAEKNRWKNFTPSEQNLKLRYDVTAKRLGFTKEAAGNYVLPLR